MDKETTPPVNSDHAERASNEIQTVTDPNQVKLPRLENFTECNPCVIWCGQAKEGLKIKGLDHVIKRSLEIEELKEKKHDELQPHEVQLIAQDDRAMLFLKASMSNDILEEISQETSTGGIMKLITEVMEELREEQKRRNREEFHTLKFKEGMTTKAFIRKFEVGIYTIYKRKVECDDAEMFADKLPSELYNQIWPTVRGVLDGDLTLEKLYKEFTSIVKNKKKTAEGEEVNMVKENNPKSGTDREEINLTQERGRGNGHGKSFRHGCGRCKTNDHHFYDCKLTVCINCLKRGHGWKKCQEPLNEACAEMAAKYRKVSFESSSIPPQTARTLKNDELMPISDSPTTNEHVIVSARGMEEDSIKTTSPLIDLNHVEYANHVGEMDSAKSVWILDSGASAHVTWMPGILKNPKPMKKGLSLANGIVIYSQQMGDLTIRQGPTKLKLTLKNVLFVPEVAKNIISIQALGSEYETVMTGRKAVIKLHTKTGNGKIALEADCESKLYQTEIEKCMMVTDEDDERMLHHKRLGHVGMERLKETLGITLGDSSKRCDACLMCKHKREKYKKSESVTEDVLDLVHIDTMGPFKSESIDGKRFVLVIVDDYSRYAEVVFMHKKSESLEKVLGVLKRWTVHTERHVKMIRSDNAKEFLSQAFVNAMVERGITRQQIVPYCSQQNGVVERTIGVIKEITTVIMHEKKLPDWVWSFAIKHAAFLRNICYHTTTTRIPYKDWFKKNFDYDTLRIFGSLAYGHIPLVKQKELKPKSIKSIFLGFEDGVKGYLLYNLEQKMMYTCRSVKFSEWAPLPDIPTPDVPRSVIAGGGSALVGTVSRHDELLQEMPESPAPDSTEPDIETNEDDPASDTVPLLEPVSGSDTAFDSPTPEPRSPDDEQDEVQGGVEVNEEPHDQDEEDDVFHDADEINPEEEETVPMEEEDRPVIEADIVPELETEKEVMTTRRSARIQGLQPTHGQLNLVTRRSCLRGAHPPRRIVEKQRKMVRFSSHPNEVEESDCEQLDQNLDLETFNILMEESESDEVIFALEEVACEKDPKTLKEALRGPMRMEWQAAADKEIGTILSMKAIQRIVPGPGDKVLATKMHVQVKRDERHQVTARKVRFVVKGFLQEQGRDFEHSFAPTTSAETLRALLTVAAVRDWEVHQMDVSAAYLHAELDERVIIEPPEGYEDDPNVKWLLKKALYGLRQAPRAWYTLVVDIMAKLGLRRLQSDMCVFVKGEDKNQVIIVIHVDDFLVLGPNLDEVKKVKKQLGTKLEIKDLGEVHRFLNLMIRRDRPKRIIEVTQEHCLEQIEEDYPEFKGYTSTIPISKNCYESDNKCSTEDKAKYLQVFGSLNYVTTWTRLDLCYGMSILGQHIQSPTEEAKEALMKLVNYAITTKRRSLKLGKLSEDELTVYTDANWGQDSTDRKSRSGVLLMMYNSPVLWRSKKQTVVARSTAESEYIAAAAGARELGWLANFLAECHLPTKTIPTLKTDNMAVTKILEMATSSKRLRHLDLPFHEVRNMLGRNAIKIQFVRSAQQLADMFTKAATTDILTNTLSALKMITPTVELRGSVVNYLYSLFA